MSPHSSSPSPRPCTQCQALGWDVCRGFGCLLPGERRLSPRRAAPSPSLRDICHLPPQRLGTPPRCPGPHGRPPARPQHARFGCLLSASEGHLPVSRVRSLVSWRLAVSCCHSNPRLTGLVLLLLPGEGGGPSEDGGVPPPHVTPAPAGAEF